MTRPKNRAWASNTALVVFSVAFALVLCEIALRIAGFSYPSTWRFDEITGKSLIPGAEMLNDTEGYALIRINSDGLRDVEHTIDKPVDTLRIAILGDSYAEAIQLPIEQTFWKILESELADCQNAGDKQVEVINFGVSGFGTGEELLTLRHKVWKYQPDIVLLAFLTGNDIRNNVRELQNSGNKPYFVYQDGILVLDDSYLDKSKSRLKGSILGDWWFALSPRSRVVQLIHKFYTYTDQRKGGEKKATRKKAQKIHERGLDIDIYSPPADPLWIEAWNITEELIRMINADVLAHNASFVLVTLSNSVQVNPDQEQRQQAAASLELDNLLYPDLRIQQVAREANIRNIMLVTPLQEWAEKNAQCIHGFENASPCGGHWNENGHRVAGKMIADGICDALPLPMD